MTNVLINIVDDDDYSAEFILHLLRKSGVTHCKIFTNPETFLKGKEDVHVCILDYRFNNSGMDGLTITEELIKRNKRCRIIIVTVLPDFKNFMKVYNAGAWKYLDKSDDSFESDLIKYVKIAIELVAEEIELLNHIKQRYNKV